MPVRRPHRKTKARKKASFSPATLGAAGVVALAAVPAANAATYTVSTLNDSGAGSLRQAIQDANANPGADVIAFASSLTGTITLAPASQLSITDSVDIQGPGPAVITVSGNNLSRVFYMYNGTQVIDVTISGLTIANGNASIGAGIINFDEILTVEDVVLTGNQAQIDGAAIWADGFDMTLTIRDTTITGNTAADNGGGIYVEDTGGPLLIENSVISNNQSGNQGGGIYFYDPDTAITIRDTTISGNTAGTVGGGIYLYDTDGSEPFVIERSTISGNEATAGGGIFFYGPDTDVTIENSTISGNSATAGNGGGIFFYDVYTVVSMNFVTIADNSATGSGGGVFVEGGAVNFSNSIIGDNTATTGPDLANGKTGSFDLAYTLLESSSGVNFTASGVNILDTDPQLGALANNGGPTATHRPALSSPVVNAADPAFAPPPTTDQRGEPRVYPTRADMGALELVGGVIQFNPTTYSVAENTPGSVSLTVVRDVGPDPATVDYTTNNGSATAGSDYTTTSGTLTFAPGDLSETITVPILDDSAVEGNETFTATLSNPSADATLGAGTTATVTVTDFEPGQLVFSSPTYSVNESGAGSITLTVNRVNGSSGPASVSYATAPGTATAGSDYTTTSGTLNWADGDAAAKTIVVPILDDTAAEGNENFTVALSAPTGATIGAPGSATVTIVDDPAGTAQFTISSLTTPEEGGAVTLTVTRTGGTEGPLAVTYNTTNGTATAPQDYTPAAGTITFPAGDATPQSININIVDDNLNEVDEMFSVNLSGPGVGAPSSVTITIAASDMNIPTLSWFGRIVLALMSGLLGLYAIVRNRFSVMLFVMLLAGVVAAPQLSAAPKQTKEVKGGKFAGTLVSVTKSDTTIVLNLTGGVSLTLPVKTVHVVDARASKPKPGTLAQVVQGTSVVVKLKTDEKGDVKDAKIKLTE